MSSRLVKSEDMSWLDKKVSLLKSVGYERDCSHMERYRHKFDVKMSREFENEGKPACKTSKSDVENRAKAHSLSLDGSLSWADRCFEEDMPPSKPKDKKAAAVKGQRTLNSIENSVKPLPSRSKPQREYETDITILKRREKQIEYGKNTKSYKKYLAEIPKSKRRSCHIWTPNKFLKYSRRSWDNQVRMWRRELHCWDSGSDTEPEVDEVVQRLEPLLQHPGNTKKNGHSSSSVDTD